MVPTSAASKSKAAAPPLREPRPKQELGIELRYGTLFIRVSGTTVDLEGESPRSRLARALVASFRTAPGRVLSPEALAAEVWPGAETEPSTRGRLKVAVCRLRAAGLPIITVGRGYAIDPYAILGEVT